MTQMLYDNSAELSGNFNSSVEADRTTTCDFFCQDLDLFCEQHAYLGSDAALQRKAQTQRRVKWIEALWNDSVRFEAIMTSGRYVRLRALTKRISDCDERAWRQLKNEVIAIRNREFPCGAGLVLN